MKTFSTILFVVLALLSIYAVVVIPSGIDNLKVTMFCGFSALWWTAGASILAFVEMD